MRLQSLIVLDDDRVRARGRGAASRGVDDLDSGCLRRCGRAVDAGGQDRGPESDASEFLKRRLMAFSWDPEPGDGRGSINKVAFTHEPECRHHGCS